MRACSFSHAGTDEISVIEWAALLDRAAARSDDADLFDEESLVLPCVAFAHGSSCPLTVRERSVKWMAGLTWGGSSPTISPRSISETNPLTFSAIDLGFFPPAIAGTPGREALQ